MIQAARVKSTFVELVAVDSLTFEEASLANQIKAQLEKMGFRAFLDKAGALVGGQSGNLVAVLPGTVAGAPPIMFNAHLDTVEPGRGVRVVEQDGLLMSDGSTVLGADDKAGVAAIIEMCRSIIEDGLDRPTIELVFTVAEEKGLLGAKNLDTSSIESRRAFVLDAALPVGQMTVSAPYQNTIEIRFLGKSAHAGVNPEDGVNAVKVASEAVAAMEVGRIDEQTTANIGVVSGGTAVNIVPDHAVIKGEARSLSEARLTAQTDSMLAAAKTAAQNHGAGCQPMVHREYDGFELSADSDVVRWATGAARRIGLNPGKVSTGGGSDTNVFNSAGLQALNLGVGYLDPHTTRERLALADLVRSAEWASAIVEEAAGATAEE